MTPKSKKPAYRLASKAERELLKNQVMAYQNEGLIKKYCYEMNVPTSDANSAFTELKKFLFICGTTDEKLSPSIGLDNIWHQFILFTKDYIKFCKKYFGQIIHHLPDVEFYVDKKKENLKLYIRTCDIAEQEFGRLNPKFWLNPNFVNTANCSGDDAGTTDCNPDRTFINVEKYSKEEQLAI